MGESEPYSPRQRPHLCKQTRIMVTGISIGTCIGDPTRVEPNVKAKRVNRTGHKGGIHG